MPFECADPQANEATLPGELPAATALRLAEAKARAVALRFPDALVVGSDQVASCEGIRLDKPGTYSLTATDGVLTAAVSTPLLLTAS